MWYAEDVAPDYHFRIILLRGFLRFVPSALSALDGDWDATIVFVAIYLDSLEQIAASAPENARQISDLAQNLRKPTIRSLEQLLHIPRSTIHRKLTYLEERGIIAISGRRYSWILDEDGLARSIKMFLLPTLEIERLHAEIARYFDVPVKRGPSGIATKRP